MSASRTTSFLFLEWREGTLPTSCHPCADDLKVVVYFHRVAEFPGGQRPCPEIPQVRLFE